MFSIMAVASKFLTVASFKLKLDVLVVEKSNMYSARILSGDSFYSYTPARIA